MTASQRSSGSASTRGPPTRRATRSRRRRARDMAGIIRAMPGSEATRSHRVLRGFAVLSLIAMAFFAGMLVERLRLDAQREDMLRRYDQVLRQYREQQMISEKTIQR
jgi:hypothetical protein